MKKQFYSPPFLSPKSEISLQELDTVPKIAVVCKCEPAPPEGDAVFLSHGHLEHSAHLSVSLNGKFQFTVERRHRYFYRL